MKKLVNFLLTLSVLAGLGYVLRLGFQKHETGEADEGNVGNPSEHATAATPDAKPESFTVTLGKEQAKALGLTTEKPAPLDHAATAPAYGSVLDPAPLITLDSELALASAALTASKSNHDRTVSLAANKDASQQAAEASLAQYTADRLKLESLTHSARLQWGTLFDKDAKARRIDTEQLVSGSTALIRVEVLPNDTLPDLPKSATLILTGHGSTPITTNDIQPAVFTDPKTQAQGYLLRVDQPPFPLRPGMAVSASLSLPGPPRPGFAIPRSAILRHDGLTWIYLQEKVESREIEYLRQPINLDTPLETSGGWFTPAVEGLSAESLIITTGAASLLSEELKAQGSAPEID